MTQNQIAYRNAKENERHNTAVEQENARHNVISEKLQNFATAVQKYQVAVNNAHYARMDYETWRSNRAREDETKRSNLANEQLKEFSNKVSAATLAETSRHQQTLDSLQAQLNASTEAMNYARAEDFYSGAELKRNQAITETYRPGQIVNEIDLTNSSANLNREKLSTESTTQFVNVTKGIQNIVSAGTDIFSAVGNLLKGSSNKSGSSFFDQMNTILDAK